MLGEITGNYCDGGVAARVIKRVLLGWRHEVIYGGLFHLETRKSWAGWSLITSPSVEFSIKYGRIYSVCLWWSIRLNDLFLEQPLTLKIKNCSKVI